MKIIPFLILLSLVLASESSFALKILSQKVTISVTSSAPLGTQDFQTRCSQSGVLRCIGFDSASDIAGVDGDNHGTLPGTDNLPVLDTSVKASGNSALKFTVTSSSANSGGSFWTNFSDNLLTQFDSGQEFYVQWRQRFTPQYISMNLINLGFPNVGGWKQVIVGAGDKPGCTASNSLTLDSGGSCVSSCSPLETNVQNTMFRGFPQMYNSCQGSSSTQGGTLPNGTPAYNPFEFKLQNAMPAPFCLYSQGQTNPTTFLPPTGNCFGYFANEWMTFKMHIVIGQRTGSDPQYFANSHVDLWVAREGQPSKQVFSWGPYDLAAGDAAQNLKYGKVYLLSYDSNNFGSVGPVPTAITWYDELIISSKNIADPQ